MLEVAFTNKSVESAKRLHENLKNYRSVAYQEIEPPGKLYQTPAPHTQSIIFGCATRKTLCLPYALVVVGGCAREEQEGNMKQGHWAPQDQKRVRSQRFWECGNWERIAALRCVQLNPNEEPTGCVLFATAPSL